MGPKPMNDDGPVELEAGRAALGEYAQQLGQECDFASTFSNGLTTTEIPPANEWEVIRVEGVEGGFDAYFNAGATGTVDQGGFRQPPQPETVGAKVGIEVRVRFTGGRPEVRVTASKV